MPYRGAYVTTDVTLIAVNVYSVLRTSPPLNGPQRAPTQEIFGIPASIDRFNSFSFAIGLMYFITCGPSSVGFRAAGIISGRFRENEPYDS